MPEIGEKAPEFCLPDTNYKRTCLKDFGGKNIVLYFYPKDNTPGCTLEAIDFSKYRKEFEKFNTVILGVSKDSCSSHQKFVDSKHLTIILLSDEDGKVHKKYGVTLVGLTIRTTFLIDKGGIIRRIWHKVKVKGHAKEVLDIVSV